MYIVCVGANLRICPMISTTFDFTLKFIKGWADCPPASLESAKPTQRTTEGLLVCFGITLTFQFFSEK